MMHPTPQQHREGAETQRKDDTTEAQRNGERPEAVQRRLLRNYAIIAALVLMPLALLLWGAKSDVKFCQHVFRGLVQGQMAVQRHIDWSRLKALEADVSAVYLKIPREQERSQFRAVFIVGFSKGFAQVEGKAHAFQHWRVVERKPERVVVAADYVDKGKTLLFTVSTSRPRKLIGLQWKS